MLHLQTHFPSWNDGDHWPLQSQETACFALVASWAGQAVSQTPQRPVTYTPRASRAVEHQGSPLLSAVVQPLYSVRL